MTQTDPPDNPNPLSPFTDLLNTIAQAFAKLPPMLAYGGLIAVLIIVGLSLFDVVPDALLWIPASTIAAFLIYTFINRYFNLQEKKLDISTPSQTAPSVEPPKPEQKPATSDSDEQPPPQTVSSANNRDKLERRYLNHLLNLHNQLPLALMDVREADDSPPPLQLHEIFTPLDVPAQQQRLDDLTDEALLQTERLPRQRALKALSQPENKQLVLLGDPGSGKSTLTSYLTLGLAGDYLGKAEMNQSHLHDHGWDLSHQRLWPVHVVLREYAAHGLPQGQSLWAFMAAELQKPSARLADYVPLLKAQLENQPCLVMLDGLDEVDQATSVRDALKQEILNFVTDFPQARLLVTSRPYAYGGGWHLPNFQVTRLLPFAMETREGQENNQIGIFVNQWYTAKGRKDGSLGAERAEQFAGSLLQQIGRNHYLRELAEQPILLTMMVLVHRGQQGAQLPRKRAKLYEECVKLLLVRWQKGKTVSGQETPELIELLGLDIDELLKRLAEVAYCGHRDQPSDKRTADIPGKTLAGILYGSPGRQIKLSYEQLVQYLRDKAGLLSDHGPNTEGSDHIYRFPHRSFQEYLAGLHLLNDNDYPQRLVAAAAGDPHRWRETILLAAGSTPFSHMLWTMVQELCPEPPPTGAANAAWQAFLAGQVLVDTEQLTAANLGNSAQKTRSRIQQWQQAIVTRGLLPPRDRALAGEALAALGDERPGVLRCDEMRFGTVPGGPFWLDSWQKGAEGIWYEGLDKPYWLAQYPLTVVQFREFVDATGFKPRYKGSLAGVANWPVAYLNWYDALAFCDWLDGRWRAKGWLPVGYRLTLPSETEWEKAARGGRQVPQVPQLVTASQLTATLDGLPPMQDNGREGDDLSRRPFPWGDEPEQEEIAKEKEKPTTLYRANNESAGIGGRCAVGAFPAGASPYGCLDMSGQVWEWTRSLHGQPYPPQATAQFETVASQNKKGIVLRGGAYYQDQNGCSVRYWLYPRHGIRDGSGVRVCVSPFLPSDG
ncbi:MAG: SUMF1/EgtB/PvdO family nonheme iron enzyme [Chloroflexota bacterium]